MMALRLQPAIRRTSSTLHSRYAVTAKCRRVFTSPAAADGDEDDEPKLDPRQLVHALYNPTIRMSPLGVSKSILPVSTTHAYPFAIYIFTLLSFICFSW